MVRALERNLEDARGRIEEKNRTLKTEGCGTPIHLARCLFATRRKKDVERFAR